MPCRDPESLRRIRRRIEPSAVVAYIETRKTLTPLLSGRRFRAVE